MSPELEELLAALYERDTCEPEDRARWETAVEHRVSDALAGQPGVSRDEFLLALHPRYLQFRRAKRKPPALPPNA